MRKSSPEKLFGDAVREARESAGVSQEELSFRAEIHRTYVSQLERGLKSPTLGVMLRIAEALKVKAADLVARVESP